MRVALALCIALFMAHEAMASTSWVRNSDPADADVPCKLNAAQPNYEVVSGERCYFHFTDSDSTTGDSNAITVKATTALFCLDPNTGATGIDTAQVKIRKCLTGAKPTSSPENSCIDITGTALDGTEGDTDTQNACLRVKGGVYFVDITAASGSGDAPIVQVEGEK